MPFLMHRNIKHENEEKKMHRGETNMFDKMLVRKKKNGAWGSNGRGL
jgi:hypothetical protein